MAHEWHRKSGGGTGWKEGMIIAPPLSKVVEKVEYNCRKVTAFERKK